MDNNINNNNSEDEILYEDDFVETTEDDIKKQDEKFVGDNYYCEDFENNNFYIDRFLRERSDVIEEINESKKRKKENSKEKEEKEEEKTIDYKNIDEDKICGDDDLDLIGVFYDENRILYDYLWMDHKIENGVLKRGFINSSKFNKYIDQEGACKLPSRIVRIHDKAFWGYGKIKSIEIPDTVKEVGKGAFMFCPNLEYIKFPEGITHLEELVVQSCDSLKKVVIPDSVKSIGRGALRYNFEITSIDLPKNLESIGELAFCGCKNLKSITLPGSLKFIHSTAFKYCWKLDNVYAPNEEICMLFHNALAPYIAINYSLKINVKDGDTYREWKYPLDMRCVHKEEIKGGKCPFCSKPLNNGDPIYCMHDSDSPIEAQHQAHVGCVLRRLQGFCTCPVCRKVLENPIRIYTYMEDNKDWIEKEYGIESEDSE